MEGPDKLFLLVSEEEVKSHPQRADSALASFWLFVQTLFLLLFVPLFLAMGYGFPVFLIYVVLLGAENISSFAKKPVNFILSEEAHENGLLSAFGEKSR